MVFTVFKASVGGAVHKDQLATLYYTDEDTNEGEQYRDFIMAMLERNPSKKGMTNFIRFLRKCGGTSLIALIDSVKFEVLSKFNSEEEAKEYMAMKNNKVNFLLMDQPV